MDYYICYEYTNKNKLYGHYVLLRIFHQNNVLSLPVLKTDKSSTLPQ